MKQVNKLFFVIMIITLMAVPAIAKTSFQQARMVPVNFAKIARQAKPGVVNIQTEKIIKGGGRVYSCLLYTSPSPRD